MNRPTPQTSPGTTRRLTSGLLAVALCLVPGVSSAASGPDLGQIEVAQLAAEPAAWVPLDARPRARWAEGHVLGARSFYWEEFTPTDSDGVRYRILPPEELSRALGKLGIDQDTPVVVYGDADSSWGGEGWAAWVLTWLGHRAPVRLLAGGVQAWQAEGLPLAAEDATPIPPKTYRVSLRPEMRRTVGELRPPAPGEVLVDTRPALESFGRALPGATRLSWKKLYRGPHRRHLGPKAYRDILSDAGIGPGQTPVFYCTGGVRSAYAWLVHQLSGTGPAANFEGGTAAWKQLGASP